MIDANRNYERDTDVYVGEKQVGNYSASRHLGPNRVQRPDLGVTCASEADMTQFYMKLVKGQTW